MTRPPPPKVTLWYADDDACRHARRVLEGFRCELTLVELDKTAPDETQVRALLAKLGKPVRKVVRTDVPSFASYQHAGEDELIRAMARHPELLPRPVMVVGERAMLARPLPPALMLLVPATDEDSGDRVRRMIRGG